MLRPILFSALVSLLNNVASAQSIEVFVNDPDVYEYVAITIDGTDETDICVIREAIGNRVRVRMESYDPVRDRWEVTSRLVDVPGENGQLNIYFHGMDGNDLFYFENPDDFQGPSLYVGMNGGPGLDDLQGGPGENVLVGGFGDGMRDILRGSSGQDTFRECYEYRTVMVKPKGVKANTLTPVQNTLVPARVKYVEYEDIRDLNPDDGDYILPLDLEWNG